MEDLLASIRRAIHDDIGELPEPGADPQYSEALHGSMRELRVRVGSEVSAAAAEIQELRKRISRTRELPPRRPAAREPIFEDHPAPPEEPRDTEKPGLSAMRPSFAEAELASYVSTLREASRRFSADPEAVIPPAAQGARSSNGQLAARTGILSEEASTAAATAFNRLADTILNKAVGDRSIEDLAREMLKNLLKQWLDEHLPSLVERLVREEIERVARRGR